LKNFIPKAIVVINCHSILLNKKMIRRKKKKKKCYQFFPKVLHSWRDIISDLVFIFLQETIFTKLEKNWRVQELLMVIWDVILQDFVQQREFTYFRIIVAMRENYRTNKVDLRKAIHSNLLKLSSNNFVVCNSSDIERLFHSTLKFLYIFGIFFFVTSVIDFSFFVNKERNTIFSFLRVVSYKKVL